MSNQDEAIDEPTSSELQVGQAENSPTSTVDSTSEDTAPQRASAEVLKIFTRELGELRLSSNFSGPVPPPSTLKAYNNVVPGLAERIIAQAESQTQHRMRIEEAVIKSDITRANWGLSLGFIVSMAFLGGGIYLLLNNHDWAGTSVIVSGAVSLVSTFVYGSNSRKTERIEKEQMLLNNLQKPSQKSD